MKKFDINKMNRKLLDEIRACKNTEELKTLFASKQLEVPDSKLNAIFKLSEKAPALDLDDLKLICGGCCPVDGCAYEECGFFNT